MTKAEKMFEELNYTFITETKEKVVYRLIDYFIEFDKRNKYLCVYEEKEVFYDDFTKIPVQITCGELQAIYEQLKELGWLND